MIIFFSTELQSKDTSTKPSPSNSQCENLKKKGMRGTLFVNVLMWFCLLVVY